MAVRRKSQPQRPRRGSSSAWRDSWKETYEKTPYNQLPWFEPGPSGSVKLAVAEGIFPRKGAILDVGCGAGSNVLFLAKRGFHAHGTDLSPGAIAAAKKRAAKTGLNADFRVGDALDLPFPNGRLDGVIDHGCFHTLPIRRRGDYAKEIYRVLRPGGSFLLAWVAREHTGERGPPHRPSLGEITTIFEPKFLFHRTGFQPGRKDGLPAIYFAFLSRRSVRQPPPR